MITIKTVNKDNDISVLPVTGDVSFVNGTRTVFYRGFSGGDDELMLDDGEVAYVVNDMGKTIAIFQ